MPRTSPPRKDKNRVPRQKRELPVAPPKEAERIAKVVARAGLGSRREIEEWIEAGRVAVNGEVLTTPAVTVTPADTITIDGEPLPERERTRLFLYHKPKGVVTTNRDPEGRTTLFEILPKGLPRLVSVGRLDLNSEGLLLLTNDGGLARVLELPETGWLRRYRVRANGEIDQAKLDTLLKGITVDGVEYGPIEAELDRVQGANAWITVSLREGKNREIRNVLGALGLAVNRLIRVSYGPFQLGDIAEGAVEEVRTRVLRDQIGADLAAAAGADFTGLLVEREIEETPVRPAYRPAGRRQEAADKAGGIKVPARRAPREREEFDAPVEDIIHPAAGPRVRRRGSEEHGTERVGTVADRKGRTVKVERVRASKEEAPRRAARPAAGGAGPKGRPGRPAAGEGDARPFRRSREDGATERPRRAEGRPSFRDEAPRGRGPREEKEDFRRRPTRSGSGDERPRRYEDDGGIKRSGPRREGERPQGDRPFRARPDRPEGERPSRARPRPEGRGGDYGDKPARGRSFGGDRPEGERPARARPRPESRGGDYGDKPARSRSFGGDRPEGERPARARPRPEGRGGDYGDKPARGRSFGGDRPEGERPAPTRPRPEGRGGDYGDRPQRERSFGDKPAGRARSFDDRPGGGKGPGKALGRPGASRDGKPGGFGGKGPGKGGPGKPGGRPTGGKPGAGRSGPGKPGGPRGKR